MTTILTRATHLARLATAAQRLPATAQTGLTQGCGILTRTLCTKKDLPDMGAGGAPGSFSSPEDGGLYEDAGKMLDGKKTRDTLHQALQERAADSMRYEYYAQRADIECETDAAITFRCLSESAKQQSMGYLELMEEYGEANLGSTMDNLETSSAAERAKADGVLSKAATEAGEEGFHQIEEWFEDMQDAGHRAATKLDAIQEIIEEELMDGTELGNSVNGKK